MDASSALPNYLYNTLPSLTQGWFKQVLEHILALISGNNFLAAVKAVREASGADLKTSKEFCDMLRKYITPGQEALAKSISARESLLADNAKARDQVDALQDEVERLKDEIAYLKNKPSATRVLGPNGSEMLETIRKIGMNVGFAPAWIDRAPDTVETIAKLIRDLYKDDGKVKKTFDGLVHVDQVRGTFKDHYNVLVGGMNVFWTALEEVIHGFIVLGESDDNKELTAKQWRETMILRIGELAMLARTYEPVVEAMKNMGKAVTGTEPDMPVPSRTKVDGDLEAEALETLRRRVIEEDWHAKLDKARKENFEKNGGKFPFVKKQ